MRLSRPGCHVKEIYDNVLRVGGILALITGLLGFGRLLQLDATGYLVLATFVVVVVSGATQFQLLRDIWEAVIDEGTR